MSVQHLRGHLGMRLELGPDEGIRGVLPLSPRCRNADGSLSIGAVATMADVAAVTGTHDNRFERGVVTSFLSLRLLSAPQGDAIVAEAKAVRIGRTGVTARGRLLDSDSRLIGLISATSTALAGDGATHQRNLERRNDMYDYRNAPTTGPSMTEFLGLEAKAAVGERLAYEMPFHEPLRNVNSVLHGGGACLIVEHAARCAAADLGLTIVDMDELDVHFLAPGVTGPFTATVETVGGPGARRAMLVEVVDDGRDGRPIALGTVSATVAPTL